MYFSGVHLFVYYINLNIRKSFTEQVIQITVKLSKVTGRPS